MKKDQLNNLFVKLRCVRNLNEEEKETIAHALIDIKASFDVVYNEILPKLLNIQEDDIEGQNDLFFDLKDEFTHILYHIEDAKLYNAKYWE